MIQEFIEAWEKNKDNLREAFNEKLREDTYLWDAYSYEDLMNLIITKVFNSYSDQHEFSKCLTINDGDYQGTYVFIFHNECYQPFVGDYYYSYVNYGSCSVCDTLQAIFTNDNQQEIVNDLMTLCLHLVQRCKQFTGEECD